MVAVQNSQQDLRAAASWERNGRMCQQHPGLETGPCQEHGIATQDIRAA